MVATAERAALFARSSEKAYGGMYVPVMPVVSGICGGGPVGLVLIARMLVAARSTHLDRIPLIGVASCVDVVQQSPTGEAVVLVVSVISFMKAPSQAPVQSLGVPPGERHAETAPAIAVLVLFAILGLVHLAMFLVNRRRGHRFVFSASLFALTVLRIAALVLRLCWSWHPSNSRLALSAQLLVACGTVIPTVINLFFAQRLIRSQHPHVGWSTPSKVLMPGLPIATTIFMIIALITSLVISLYTHNPRTLSALHKIQQAGLSWFVFATFLPTIVATAAIALPSTTEPDPFGSGTTRAQVSLLCASSTLQAGGAAIRLASACLPPVPLSAATPWYLSRQAFYTATFTPDLATLALYALFRVDRRFHVPDDAGALWSYSAELVFDAGRAVLVRRARQAVPRVLVELEPRLLAIDLRTGRYRLLGAVFEAGEIRVGGC